MLAAVAGLLATVSGATIVAALFGRVRSRDRADTGILAADGFTMVAGCKPNVHSLCPFKSFMVVYE